MGEFRMTVKELISALEKVKDKNRKIVVSDINVNLLVGAYYDILDVGMVVINDIERPDIVIAIDFFDEKSKVKRGNKNGKRR
jgi:hypothetical protein